MKMNQLFEIYITVLAVFSEMAGNLGGRAYFGRVRFLEKTAATGVCVHISAISWPIFKIQKLAWAVFQGEANEPGYTSNTPREKSVAPQTLTGDPEANLVRVNVCGAPAFPPRLFELKFR